VTEISFHFNVPERLLHAVKLVKKTLAAEKAMWITADAGTLDRLDRLLWTHSPLDFVPHSFFDAAPSVVVNSKIVLGDSCHAGDNLDMLLNLGPGIPTGFEKFEKLIELVGLDAVDKEEGRIRWKHYAKNGYDIRRHDISQTPAQ
jgi:DNA polymerase III subunit chi